VINQSFNQSVNQFCMCKEQPVRPLQYDSLFLVLPPAYSRDTCILGHYLYLYHMTLCVLCIYAISYSHGVSQCYSGPGKQGRHLIALEIVQCHSVWGEFIFCLS